MGAGHGQLHVPRRGINRECPAQAIRQAPPQPDRTARDHYIQVMAERPSIRSRTDRLPGTQPCPGNPTATEVLCCCRFIPSRGVHLTNRALPPTPAAFRYRWFRLGEAGFKRLQIDFLVRVAHGRQRTGEAHRGTHMVSPTISPNATIFAVNPPSGLTLGNRSIGTLMARVVGTRKT